MSRSTQVVTPAERVLIWHLAGRPRLVPPSPSPSHEVDGLPVMCPSQSEEHGTIILGHIIDGEQLVRTPRHPNRANISAIPDGASLRLAGQCHQAPCAYWNDSCQLAAAMVHPIDTIGKLPACPIRKSCRWWIEHGSTACGTCSLVSYPDQPLSKDRSTSAG